mgnify:CR=1 FL=1
MTLPCGILSKYELVTQHDHKVHKNVWKVLNNKSILSDDIDRLVYILGVTYEQRIIIPNNRHHRSNRYFKCNDCKRFRLHFINHHSDESTTTIQYKILMKNYMDHDPDCVLKSSKLTKANHIIEDSEYLITAIKETDLSTIQKSGLDIAMLLSTLGIQRFDVNKYTLNRSIAKLREKFTTEIPNYYKMLVPYLKNTALWKKLHPVWCKQMKTIVFTVW